MLKQKDKHLSPEEVAICAEALMESRFDTLEPELKTHLQMCEQCAAEVAMVTEISIPLKESAPQKPGRHYLKHPAIPFLIAAVLLGVILLVVFPIINSQRIENQVGVLEDIPQIISPDDSQPMIDPSESFEIEGDEQSNTTASDQGMSAQLHSEDLLLSAFRPNPELEMLVANFQSAYRGNNITVTTVSSIYFPDQASLIWNNPQGIDLLVEIIDNEGNEVVSVSTDSGSYTIPQLKPGLYYWKLIEESDFDLIFAGKITHRP